MRPALHLAFFAALLLTIPAAHAADEVTRYPIYMSGKKSGEQVVTRHDDGCYSPWAPTHVCARHVHECGLTSGSVWF